MWSELKAQLAASAIDLSLLHTNKNLAILFYSGLISRMGSMITYVALPFQVKELTDSYLAVGLIGAAELVPLIAFGLYGGMLADAFDRRKLIIVGEIAALALSALLLINAQLAEPRVWVLYVVAAAFSAVNGATSPSYNAVIPRIVAHEDLPKASALMGLRWQVAVITGPAVGGFIISTWSVSAGYIVDVISYLLSLLLLARLTPLARMRERKTPPSISALVDGVRYAVKRQDLMGTYLIDLAAMFFAMPTALFPFWAESLRAPSALGLLYSAGTVGALLVTLTSGWTLRIYHHGKAIIYAALAWGFAIALAGVIDSVPWVLLCLVIAGGADHVSVIFRSTIWNQTIPDELRGRLAGIEVLSYTVGPISGQLRAGGMAAITGLRGAIVGGGLLCIAAVAATSAFLPRFRKYDSRTDPFALHEREIRSGKDSSDSGGVSAAG
jgi:MFS family permease